jgi:hypothetical protein
VSVAKPLVEEHVKAIEAHGFYLRERSGFDLVLGAMYRRVNCLEDKLWRNDFSAIRRKVSMDELIAYPLATSHSE